MLLERAQNSSSWSSEVGNNIRALLKKQKQSELINKAQAYYK